MIRRIIRAICSLLPGLRSARPVTYEQRIAAGRAEELLYLGESGRTRLFWTRWGPMYEPWDVFKAFAYVGDPGSGKTSAILGLIRQAVEAARRPLVIVVCDLKGSGPEVARFMRHLALLHRWRFYYFSPEAEFSHGFNVVENLAKCSSSPADFAESLALALRVGTGLDHEYYLGRAKRAIRNLLRAAPQARTFVEMVDYLEQLDARQLQDLEGLLDALEEYASVASLNRRSETAETRNIDFLQLVEQGRALVYVRLPRLRPLAKTLMRVVKDATVKVNSARGTAQRTEVILIVDEFHRIAGDDIVSEIQAMGRDVNLRLVLAFQNFSQVAKISNALTYELLSMPCFYFGAGDGGFSDRLFRESSSQEVFHRRPDTNETTYHVWPTLMAADLESLTRSPRQFLARIPNAQLGASLRYGWLSYCMNHSLYESFRSAGFFPRDGELLGAQLNPPYEFFRQARAERRRIRNSLPQTLARALREAAAESEVGERDR